MAVTYQELAEKAKKQQELLLIYDPEEAVIRYGEGLLRNKSNEEIASILFDKYPNYTNSVSNLNAYNDFVANQQQELRDQQNRSMQEKTDENLDKNRHSKYGYSWLGNPIDPTDPSFGRNPYNHLLYMGYRFEEGLVILPETAFGLGATFLSTMRGARVPDGLEDKIYNIVGNREIAAGLSRNISFFGNAGLIDVGAGLYGKGLEAPLMLQDEFRDIFNDYSWQPKPNGFVPSEYWNNPAMTDPNHPQYKEVALQTDKLSGHRINPYIGITLNQVPGLYRPSTGFKSQEDVLSNRTSFERFVDEDLREFGRFIAPPNSSGPDFINWWESWWDEDQEVWTYADEYSKRNGVYPEEWKQYEEYKKGRKLDDAKWNAEWKDRNQAIKELQDYFATNPYHEMFNDPDYDPKLDPTFMWALDQSQIWAEWSNNVMDVTWDASPTIQAYLEVYKPNNPVTADNWYHPTMMMAGFAELAPSMAEILVLKGAGKVMKGGATITGKGATLGAAKLKNAMVDGIMGKQKKNAKKNAAAVTMSKKEVEDMVSPLVSSHSIIPMTILEAGASFTAARDMLIEDGWSEADAIIAAGTVATLYAPVAGYIERAQFNTVANRLRWQSGKVQNTVLKNMVKNIFGKQKYVPGTIAKIGINGIDLSADVITSSWQEGMQALSEEIVNDAVLQGYGVDGDSAISNLLSEMGELGIAELDPWGFVNTDVSEEVHQSALSAASGTLLFGAVGMAGRGGKRAVLARYERRQRFKDVHERGNQMNPYIAETKDGSWTVDFTEMDADGNIVDRIGEQKVFSTKKKAENFVDSMTKQFNRMSKWSRNDIANAYDSEIAKVKPEEEEAPVQAAPVEPTEVGTADNFIQDLANEIQGQEIITADKTYEDKEIENIKGLPLGQKIVKYFDNAKDPAIFQKLENDGVINQDQRESMESAVIAEGRQVLSKKLKPPRKKITKEDNTKIDEFVNERLQENKILEYMAGKEEAISDINMAAENFGIDQKIEAKIARKVASVEEQRITAAESKRIEAQTAKATPVGATKTYTRAQLGKMTNTQLNKAAKAMNLDIDPKFISKTPDLARDIIFDAQPKVDIKPKKKGTKIKVKAPKVGQEQDIADQIEQEVVTPKAPAVAPAKIDLNPFDMDEPFRKKAADDLKWDIVSIRPPDPNNRHEVGLGNNVVVVSSKGHEIAFTTGGGSISGSNTIDPKSGKPEMWSREQFDGILYKLEKYLEANPSEINKISQDLFKKTMSQMTQDIFKDKYDPSKDVFYEADMTADKPAAAIKKAADNIIPEGATELDPSDIVTASTRKEGEKIKIQTQSNKAAETVEEAIDDCAGGDF